MEVAIELRARIEDTERRIQRDYRKTLEKVQKLKDQMNSLEQQTQNKLKALNSAIKHLNELTDSHIMRSKKAWKEYRKLEEECKQHALRPAQQDELRVICKKTEN